MTELKNVKEEAAKAAAVKKLKSQVVSKVDTTHANVVKWISEGRELYFDEESFLELPGEVYKMLSDLSKKRYNITKTHVLGADVVGNASDSIKGFTTEFGVRADDPNRQLKVSGKNPDLVYHWTRPDNFDQRKREGWVVDHESSTKTEYDESCNYKTVGGQNQPELLLMAKSKDAHKADQVKRKARRDGLVAKTQSNFQNDVEKIGGRAIIQSDNG